VISAERVELGNEGISNQITKNMFFKF